MSDSTRYLIEDARSSASALSNVRMNVEAGLSGHDSRTLAEAESICRRLASEATSPGSPTTNYVDSDVLVLAPGVAAESLEPDPELVDLYGLVWWIHQIGGMATVDYLDDDVLRLHMPGISMSYGEGFVVPEELAPTLRKVLEQKGRVQ